MPSSAAEPLKKPVSGPPDRRRWLVLALATLTNTLVAALPSMCMPVLFDQISLDLNLSLVQVGLIWGITALPGIFIALLAGAVGDRLGPRRVLVGACILVGVTGALRGLASNFATLAGAMFLFGVFSPLITMNTLKTCGMRFPRAQLGLVSGVLSMGMALGFLSGSILSATVLAPWLGGWRPVLFLYGGIAIFFGLLWWAYRPLPAGAGTAQGAGSVRASLARITRIRSVWWSGLALLGFGGCVQGALGYLPLYLRGQGWPGAGADGALAAFHTLSMIFVVPIALLSDRLGTRRPFLLAAVAMTAAGVGALGVAPGAWVWVAVVMAGMVRDGFMAIFFTTLIETEGIGTAYAGTAMGLMMVFSGLGNLIAPPLGNSLATVGPGAPFAFWSALALVGFFALLANGAPRTRTREI